MLGDRVLREPVDPDAERVDRGLLAQERVGRVDELLYLVLVGGEYELFPGGEVPVQGCVGDARPSGDRVQGGVGRRGQRLEREP